MISTANVGIAVAFWKCNNNCKYMGKQSKIGS